MRQNPLDIRSSALVEASGAVSQVLAPPGAEFLYRPVIHSSFSGGRTSAYMTKMLKDKYGATHDIVVSFSNTTREDPRTLDFVHACDQHFGFNTVWLEAVIHPRLGDGTTHRIVDYETACRDGSIFEEAIKKYGIPNLVFQLCNRELKLNPMKSYRRSIGAGDAPVAVGIRADEPRRVNAKAEEMNIIYPLVNEFPVDKQDVLDWWEDQAFNLEIEEFEGNCKGCFKKSWGKHFQQIDKDPTVYDWHRRMERDYKSVGPQIGDRFFFRGHRTVDQLFELHAENKSSPKRKVIDIYADGGCSESCEPFQMELA